MLILFKELESCFLKWWHHYTFPLAVDEKSNCPTPSPTLGVVNLFNLDTAMSLQWCLIMALICSALMTNDTELIFMCLLAVYLYLPVSVHIFLPSFVVYLLLVSWKHLLISWILILGQWLHFHFLNGEFWQMLILIKFNFFYPMLSSFSVLKNIYLCQSHEDFLCFRPEVLSFEFLYLLYNLFWVNFPL